MSWRETSAPFSLASAFFSDPRWSMAAAAITPRAFETAFMPASFPGLSFIRVPSVEDKRDIISPPYCHSDSLRIVIPSAARNLQFRLRDQYCWCRQQLQIPRCARNDKAKKPRRPRRLGGEVFLLPQRQVLQDRLLLRNQRLNAVARQVEHLPKLLIVERMLLRR